MDFHSNSKRWSEQEEQFLKTNYQNISDKEIGEVLGRTEISVRRKRTKLRLLNDVKWTEGEEYFLKTNHQNMSLKEMGEVLGRTTKSVRNRCSSLGLLKKKSYEGDSDTHKTCHMCLEVFPKTKEYFYVNSKWNYYYNYCKVCKKIKDKERRILKKLRAEKEEKEKFLKFIASNKYTCRVCWKEKFGNKMRHSTKSGNRVHNICKACDREKLKEYHLKRIEKMDFKLE